MGDYIILILIYGCLIVGIAAQILGWIYDRRDAIADRAAWLWMHCRLLWRWLLHRYFVGQQDAYDAAVVDILAAYYGELADEEEDADGPLPSVSNAAETGDDATLPAPEETVDGQPETLDQGGGGEAWREQAKVLALMRREDGSWLISQNKIREIIGRRMEEVAAIVGPLRAAQSGAGDDAQPAAPTKHSFTREELGLGKGKAVRV